MTLGPDFVVLLAAALDPGNQVAADQSIIHPGRQLPALIWFMFIVVV